MESKENCLQPDRPPLYIDAILHRLLYILGALHNGAPVSVVVIIFASGLWLFTCLSRCGQRLGTESAVGPLNSPIPFMVLHA